MRICSSKKGVLFRFRFFVWDGSNSETATGHSITTWYWLQLKPGATFKPLIYGILSALFVLLLLVWWSRNARRRDRSAP